MAGSLTIVHVKNSFILRLIYNFEVTGPKNYIIFLYKLIVTLIIHPTIKKILMGVYDVNA